MTPEPSAIVAMKPSLCGGHPQFREMQLHRLATRLGYLVLATIDTDLIPNITALVTNWRPDAVIVPTEAHIHLAEITRFCDVITLTPEANHSRGHYERFT